MLYRIIASLESTVTEGKTTKIVKTGDLPEFFINADGPGQAIQLARKVVNPCGDANAVYIRCSVDGDVAITVGEANEAA